MKFTAKPLSLILAASVFGYVLSQNPFSPATAKKHEPPVHHFDLIHLRVEVDVDYPNRTLKGATVNTLVPAKDLTSITLHAGSTLTIERVEVDGVEAKFRHENREFVIEPVSLLAGREAKIRTTYSSVRQSGGGFGQGGGWHWIEPSPNDAARMGFWTQGETEYNRDWAPTWDYPNDFATSETVVTTTSEWEVISNGLLQSATTSADGKRKTFHWKMSQPHATYLVALVGGPLTIKRAQWRDVPLMYVTPKTKAHLIESSFGDTPEMMELFSSVLGKYPWPKYSQNATYDFPGGMENVTSTTLGQDFLSDARAGHWEMSGLNAHELAHQWWGDLITCSTWGDTWINEGFSDFMEYLWFEHKRGKAALDHAINNGTHAYFGESRRYKRALSTPYFPNPDAMFDSHSYPKGAAVVHTLRRQIGDEKLFAAFKAVMTTYRHRPIDSYQLRDVFSQATGIDMKPFFDQWIFKPGHPVFRYGSVYSDSKKSVTIDVRQVQDTQDGTPIYRTPITLGLIKNGKMIRRKVQITEAYHAFEISTSGRPDAVLLDPDHDLLREIPEQPWTRDELRTILQFAPNAADRTYAYDRLLDGATDGDIDLIVAALKVDRAIFPVFRSTHRLGNLKHERLRAFFESELTHPNFGRQGAAASALGQLAAQEATVARLRAVVNDQASYPLITAALSSLATLDPVGSLQTLVKGSKLDSHRDVVRGAAYAALVRTKHATAYDVVAAAAAAGPYPARAHALRNLASVPQGHAAAVRSLVAGLADPDPQVVEAALAGTRGRKEKELLAPLTKLAEAGATEAIKRQAKSLSASLGS